MTESKNFFTSFTKRLKSLKYTRDNTQYGLIFGLLSSLIIWIRSILTFLIYDSTKVISVDILLYQLIIVTVFFLLILLMFLNIINQKSNFTRIFVIIFPFLFITVSMFGCANYFDIASQVFSFTIILIIISWVHIYDFIRRLVLYLYAFLLFNVIIYFNEGVTADTEALISFSFMAAIFAFITATLHYRVYTRQITEIYEHENTNTELKKSHNITASMLKLTQEVLRNERLESVLQLVLDETLNLIPNSQAGSILIKRENNRMEYVAARGYDLENLRKVNLTYDDLYQATFQDPYKPTIIKNLEVFDEVHLGQEKAKEIFDGAVNIAKSCLTCSFKFNNEFYGSINIDNFDSENIYTENDMYLIKQLAQELEIIISIHSLYEKALRPTKFDELTGANTRTYTIKQLTNLIKSNKCKCISICTIDINQLKSVNDHYGHDVGDSYLAFFAESIRNADIKPHIFGRIGGDEFLLIFCGLDQSEALLEVKKIRKLFSKNKYRMNDYEEEISFAAGISVLPYDGEDIGDLIKLSDKRMYDDKRTQKRI